MVEIPERSSSKRKENSLDDEENEFNALVKLATKKLKPQGSFNSDIGFDIRFWTKASEIF